MKKKRLFSRIFAAVLAVAIAAVTLITNSGAGLSVFADGDEAEATAEDNGSGETYSVKIISPDVPNDGKKYSYNFYQIIAGEVEDDGGENIIANPSWGAALGGKDFDKVPEDKSPEGGMAYDDGNAGIGYYPSSEVLLTALSGTMSCEYYERAASGTKKGPLLESAYDEYCKILNSYGVSYKSSTNYTDENYFYKRFKYCLEKNYNNTGKEQWRFGDKTRDVKGLVELLNENESSTNRKLKTVDLRAFADLLLNGVNVKVKTDTEGTPVDCKYEFITGKPQAHVDVTSKNGGPYEVTDLNPGYYLVTCVGVDGNLSNNGYSTSMPIKPVSTMLILVGPANKGVTEIVGKNAYSVPTVTLDMYQKPVKLSTNIKTGTTNWDENSHGGYVNGVEAIDTVIKESEDNWKNTGSFDYYKYTDRNDAILYRIGITLPLNFDRYKDSGYFLAVLNQYGHYSSATNNGEIDRVTNVRPYVYVKNSKSGEYTLIGSCRGNAFDTKSDAGASISTTVGNAIIETTTSDKIANKLTKVTGKNIYNKNEKLGSNAADMFCFGDLYNYTTTVTDEETNDLKDVCVFNPGDTIYIYYPAILAKQNSHLLNVNRVWAVYSNNPYAETLKTVSGNDGYTHITNGDVGITPISEANVNTYSVKLKVEGEDGKYANGAIFALYREVDVEVEGEGGKKTKTKIKEYACAAISDTVYVTKWMPESDLGAGDTIADKLFNTYDSKKGFAPFLANSIYTGVPDTGIEIRGLAAGEYYLQELTISKENSNWNNPSHSNLKTNHYELAKEPIKFNIGNEYNKNVDGYLGTVVDKEGNVVSETAPTAESKNSNTFISKLTVDFKQDNPERAIDTYIDMPNQSFGAEDPVPTKNGSITTTLNGSVYATEDGKIEIRVYHNKFNFIWLPETGGIGTTIFFIVGGTIVLMATVLIVTRFRVKRERL